MKYTFSDDEDISDALSSRRSTRPSGVSTPAEHAGPTVTSSGRQVKSRLGGLYGETMLVDRRKEIEKERAQTTLNGASSEDDNVLSGRPRRTTRTSGPSRTRVAPRDDELEDDSEAASTGDEWSGDEDAPDDPEPEFEGDDEDEEMSEDEREPDDGDESNEEARESLVVQLRYRKPRTSPHVQEYQECTPDFSNGAPAEQVPASRVMETSKPVSIEVDSASQPPAAVSQIFSGSQLSQSYMDGIESTNDLDQEKHISPDTVPQHTTMLYQPGSVVQF